MYAVALRAAVAAVVLTGSSAAASACGDIRLPQYPVCRDTPNGGVLAQSAADAEWGVGVAHQVEREFGRYFGQVPRYAFTIRDGETEHAPSLLKAGYLQFVWSSPQTAIERVEDATRAALIRKYQADGMKEPQLTAEVDRTMKLVSRDQAAGQASTAAHELGHVIFAQFWQDKPAPRATARYGTPGPDWLDEAAAILVESEASLNNRRDLLRRMMTKGGLRPLRTYLDMVQPNFKASPAPTSAAGNQPKAATTTVTTSVKVEVSASTDPAPDPSAAYYAQTLGFADFLVELSGQPRIFESIATKVSEGATFDAWLNTEGPKYRLPRTVGALNILWGSWLARNYGPKAD